MKSEWIRLLATVNGIVNQNNSEKSHTQNDIFNE